jgi:hypothetical protein
MVGHVIKSGILTHRWVETQPAKNVQYGLIQARIKLPYGYGF